jgi:hypothetical protein
MAVSSWREQGKRCAAVDVAPPQVLIDPAEVEHGEEIDTPAVPPGTDVGEART